MNILSIIKNFFYRSPKELSNNEIELDSTNLLHLGYRVGSVLAYIILARKSISKKQANKEFEKIIAALKIINVDINISELNLVHHQSEEVATKKVIEIKEKLILDIRDKTNNFIANIFELSFGTFLISKYPSLLKEKLHTDKLTSLATKVGYELDKYQIILNGLELGNLDALNEFEKYCLNLNDLTTQKIYKAKEDIAKGKLEDVLKSLNILFKYRFSNYYNEFLLIHNNFSEIVKKERVNVISQNEISIEKNKVTVAFLSLLDKLIEE